MNKIDKVAHQLLCDIEGVPSLTNVQQRETKLNLIKDAILNYHHDELDDDGTVAGQFEVFWGAYGKRVGKTPARKKFMKLKKKDREAILDTVEEFVRVHSDVQFRPHPTTYINQRRWEDELPSQRKPLPRRETKQNTWQL